MRTQIEEIDINDITSSPFQVRQISGTPELDAALLELSKNIKELGLINPITVRKIAFRAYECIAGHRRLEGCKLAKFKTIPCTVVELTDYFAEEILISENLFRQDLTPVEESQSIVQLLKSRDIEQVAKLCQKSERYVYRRMLIDKLSTTAKAAGTRYKWSAAFCESLAEHAPEQQDALIKNAADAIEVDVEEVLDGSASTADSPFFSGSIAALAESAKAVDPLPEKNKKEKKAKAIAKAQAVEKPDTVTAGPVEETADTIEIKRVLKFLENYVVDNPLRGLQPHQIILLLTSPDWVNPYDADYFSAIDTLWGRLYPSIVRRLTTGDHGNDVATCASFAIAVESIIKSTTRETSKEPRINNEQD